MSKINKTYCSWAVDGLFFSHRGQGLCCTQRPKFVNHTPYSFFVSNERKDAINKMANNEHVDFCNACYTQEEKFEVSQRQKYNADEKDRTYTKTFTNELPKKLDLDLSNFCNLRCVMCNRTRSSEWVKELNPEAENNGVWKIDSKTLDEICRLSHNLEEVQIQGGEPSIMPEYQQYFDYLIENDLAKNIRIHVITNGTNRNSKFYTQLEKFKSVSLGISVDSYGTVNDYIRYPSRFNAIDKNIRSFADTNFTVFLQNSLQNLSIFNLKEFLLWVDELITFYKTKDKVLHVIPSYVYSPDLLSIYNMSENMRNKLLLDLKFIFENKIKLNHNYYLQLKFLEKNAHKHWYWDRKGLLNYLDTLNNRRNIQIIDYIPNFYELIQ